MMYFLPVIYILMAYTAMYHVPKYNPDAPSANKMAKETAVSAPYTNKVTDPNKDMANAVPVSNAEVSSAPIPATEEAQTLQEQRPPLNNESATPDATVPKENQSQKN